MNTHSREADCRIELLTAFAFKCGVAPEYIKSIMTALRQRTPPGGTVRKAAGFMR